MPSVLDFAVPPRCWTCRGPLGRAPMICGPCRAALPWLGPVCDRCALPIVARHGASAIPRHRCPATALTWDRAVAAVAYTDAAATLLRALKDQRAPGLTHVFGAQLASVIPREVTDAEPTVVPVPGAMVRTRWRGFDGSALIAAHVARRHDLAAAPHLLRRQGLLVAPQRGSGRSQRLAPGRVRVVLASRGCVPPSVVLVDDVHTTGATLAACAEVLRAAGARSITVATWARALGGGVPGPPG